MTKMYLVETIHGTNGKREGNKSFLCSFYDGESFETTLQELITIDGETIIADSVKYRPCMTKKEAERIVQQYNDSFVANGTAADY